MENEPPKRNVKIHFVRPFFKQKNQPSEGRYEMDEYEQLQQSNVFVYGFFLGEKKREKVVFRGIKKNIMCIVPKICCLLQADILFFLLLPYLSFHLSLCTTLNERFFNLSFCFRFKYAMRNFFHVLSFISVIECQPDCSDILLFYFISLSRQLSLSLSPQ